MTLPVSCEVFPLKDHLDMKRSSIFRWPTWQNSAAISQPTNTR